MASEAYKRVRKKQLARLRRERQRRIIIVVIVIVIVLAAVITFSCSGSGKTRSASQSTTIKQTSETSDNKDTKAEETTQEETTVPDKFTISDYPVESHEYKNIISADILSPYVAVLDTKSGQIIAGREYDAQIYPASMTKVMTLIVAVEQLENLDKTFTMTAEIIDPLYRQEASMAGFAPEEKVTAEDMLYGLILPSGADAAVGLATMVAGTEENFVKLMNAKCREIGLKHTHFTNTSGLYNDKHYTTPTEMAMIMQYAMSNETCRKVLSTYQHTTKATKQHPEGILLTSTMFSRMYGTEVEGVTIIAGKTGYTAEAGSCMVSCATRGDDEYIAVTAKASGKWKIIFDAFEIYGNYIPNPPGYTRQ